MVTDGLAFEIGGVFLEEWERKQLEACVAQIRRLPPRTTITRAGAALDHCSLVFDGIVSCHLDDRQGLRQVVALHYASDFIDLNGFYRRSLDYDIATVTASTIAIIPHSALAHVLREAPCLAQKLLIAQLAEASIHRGWLFRLGRLDAMGRIAHFLCETNVRLIASGLSDGRRFALGMTQSDLAEICGLTNIHVNRVMRQLREEKICVFRSSMVEIIDVEKLAVRGQFKAGYLSYETPAPMLAPISATVNAPRATASAEIPLTTRLTLAQ